MLATSVRKSGSGSLVEPLSGIRTSRRWRMMVHALFTFDLIETDQLPDNERFYEKYSKNGRSTGRGSRRDYVRGSSRGNSVGVRRGRGGFNIGTESGEPSLPAAVSELDEWPSLPSGGPESTTS
jgi:hypothetical protein